MNFLHRPRPRHRLFIRTLYDGVSALHCPRDRGLDHAVQREQHLKPLITLKNLILSEPSKSIPLTLISQSRQTLEIPFRPIEFVRKYPSIFQEFHPGSLKIQPHIKLTPEALNLNTEENLLCHSVSYKQELAKRLLKLLMICRINKVPIFLLEKLKWELGLPEEYEKGVIPEFPDYFRVIGGGDLSGGDKVLELVCWTDEFAVSEVEKKGEKGGKIEFCLQYSKGFEMDKRYKKWVDEWQKLPYVSPYENGMHMADKTDESDKWAVGVLYEVLNLFVGKKADRENLLYFGECLGLRSRFKRALLQHPGIFYVSSKIGGHIVVLREGYKRGMLIERHSLMDMRYKYVQLMHVVKDEEKAKSTQQKSDIDVKKNEGEVSEDGEGGAEDNGEIYESSDDDDEDDDYDEAFEGENVNKRRRFKGKDAHFEEGNTKRIMARRTNGRNNGENAYRSSDKFSGRENVRGGDKQSFEGEHENNKRRRLSRKAGDFEEKNTRRNVTRRDGRSTKENDFKNSTNFSRRVNVRGGDKQGFEGEYENKRGRFSRKAGDFEEKNTRRNVTRRTYGRSAEENVYKNSTNFSRRVNVRDGDPNVPRRPMQKLDFSGNRDRSRRGTTTV